MSALDVLRQIKQARRAKGPTKIVEWGSAESVNDVGIENLTRRELRNHLEARDLPTQGTRLELIERLRSSLADEQQNAFAYKDTIDTQFLIEADLEERGSVYVVGCNTKGQLGLGDLNPRHHFTVIPQLRGLHVNYLYAGQDMTFAITDEFDVYVWGGGGTGRNGINPLLADAFVNAKGGNRGKIGKATHGHGGGGGGSTVGSKTTTTGNTGVSVSLQRLGTTEALPRSPYTKTVSNNWLEPQLVKDLTGEEIVMVTVGSSHCLALGKGGDCFVWGDNDAGQLGLGDFQNHITVAINNSFPACRQASAGGNHSAILTDKGQQVYCWGHGANGRLGVGAIERVGVPEEQRQFFCIPVVIPTLEQITQISCGADHTLALGASGVWAWGNGGGGKLGLNDQKDRLNPCLIPRLRGKSIMQICAGTWHSMALVCYPPMTGGGWVYTWGSGYHGQLAQEKKTLSLVPEVIEEFLELHLLVKTISTGSHHCAALTRDGEMYTWGSNNYGCLGR